MDTNILLFFDGHPDALPLFEALAQRICAEIDGVSVQAKKSQISFLTGTCLPASPFSACAKRPISLPLPCPDLWAGPQSAFPADRAHGRALSGPLDASRRARNPRRNRRYAHGVAPRGGCVLRFQAIAFHSWAIGRKKHSFCPKFCPLFPLRRPIPCAMLIPAYFLKEREFSPCIYNTSIRFWQSLIWRAPSTFTVTFWA